MGGTSPREGTEDSSGRFDVIGSAHALGTSLASSRLAMSHSVHNGFTLVQSRRLAEFC